MRLRFKCGHVLVLPYGRDVRQGIFPLRSSDVMATAKKPAPKTGAKQPTAKAPAAKKPTAKKK